MKLSGADLLSMRRSLLSACLSVSTSAILLYVSIGHTEQTQRNLHLAQSRFDAASGQLSAIRDDQKNMADYADRYGVLLDQQIIGDEQRLDWIEGLEKIRRQNLAMSFHYNIAPQKAYSVQHSIDSGNFDIRYSEMTLRLELLHESQLLDFLAALRSQIKGLYQLKECTLQRIDTNSTDEQHTASQLKAECNGGWITLKHRNPPK